MAVPDEVGRGAEPVLDHAEIRAARKLEVNPGVEMAEDEVVDVPGFAERLGKLVERLVLVSEDIFGLVLQTVML